MSASLVTAAIFGVKKRKNTEKENIGHFFFLSWLGERFLPLDGMSRGLTEEQ